MADVQAVTLGLDLPHGFLGFVGVPAGDDDAGAPHCHGNGSVLANARVPTCGGNNRLKAGHVSVPTAADVVIVHNESVKCLNTCDENRLAIESSDVGAISPLLHPFQDQKRN